MQTSLESPARVAVPAASAPRTALPSTLDTLARLDCSALEALFASAQPVALHALHGHPRGRVLAIPGLDAGPVAAVLRTLHASPMWPWEGKSFDSRAGATEGRGINRAQFVLRGGLFPFRTYETASVIDGGPCVAIDYDVPTNPASARPIYDEVRRAGNGLYLGRGMRRRSAREPKLVLWFALDSNVQDRPVEFRPVERGN